MLHKSGLIILRVAERALWAARVGNLDWLTMHYQKDLLECPKEILFPLSLAAARQGDLKLLQQIYERGPAFVDPKAFLVACLHRQRQVARFFLEQDSLPPNIEAIISTGWMEEIERAADRVVDNDLQFTFLRCAAGAGLLNIMKRLFEGMEPINRDRVIDAILTFGILSGHLPILEYFLRKNVPLELSHLGFAVQSGSEEMFDRVLGEVKGPCHLRLLFLSFCKQKEKNWNILKKLYRLGNPACFIPFRLGLSQLTQEEYFLLWQTVDLLPHLTPELFSDLAATPGHEKLVELLYPSQTDFDLKINEETFRVHLESVRKCDYFKAREKFNTQEPIQETKPEILKQLLRFLHTGHLEITHDNFRELAEVSSRYFMEKAQDRMNGWLAIHPECAHWKEWLLLRKDATLALKDT